MRVALQIPGIDIHETLQVHRRHAVEVMQRYTQIKAAAAEDDVPLALVADTEFFRLEGIMRWLDAADVRLKQLSSGRPSPAQQRLRRTERAPNSLRIACRRRDALTASQSLVDDPAPSPREPR